MSAGQNLTPFPFKEERIVEKQHLHLFIWIPLSSFFSLLLGSDLVGTPSPL